MKVLEADTDAAELDLICQVIARGEYSQGFFVELFEKHLADYLGVNPRNVVAVSSGTSALHLAYLLTEKKCLTIPAATFVSTGNMAKLAGKEITFVDVDEQSWNTDDADVGVDLFGNPLKYHPLIEDAAEALGSETTWSEKCGRLGEISVLSFFENKIITSGGEGGALVFKDSEKAESARLLRQHGKDYSMLHHQYFGFNYRMTEIQAAFGIAQLSKINRFIKRKRAIYKHYFEELSSYVTFQRLNGPSNHWATVILTPVKKRDAIVNAFSDLKIPWRPTFKPLTEFSWFEQTERLVPMSKDIWETGICLPSSIKANRDYVDAVCGVVKRCCQ